MLPHRRLDFLSRHGRVDEHQPGRLGVVGQLLGQELVRRREVALGIGEGERQAVDLAAGEQDGVALVGVGVGYVLELTLDDPGIARLAFIRVNVVRPAVEVGMHVEDAGRHKVGQFFLPDAAIQVGGRELNVHVRSSLPGWKGKRLIVSGRSSTPRPGAVGACR